MRAVVVYESHGCTRAAAEAVGRGLAPAYDVLGAGQVEAAEAWGAELAGGAGAAA
jgi:hypothetical protein